MSSCNGDGAQQDSMIVGSAIADSIGDCKVPAFNALQ